jgi:hypothetical protein
MLAPSTFAPPAAPASLRLRRYKWPGMPWERLQGRRRTVALATAGVIAVAAAAILVAVLSGRQDTPSVSGAPKDVVTTVTQFESALAGRDWAGICNRLYAKKARAAAGGAHCPSALAQSAGGLRDPRVKIVSVVVRGQAATVTVAASVNGKPPVTDAIQLVRENGQYRIASAGTG